MSSLPSAMTMPDLCSRAARLVSPCTFTQPIKDMSFKQKQASKSPSARKSRFWAEVGKGPRNKKCRCAHDLPSINIERRAGADFGVVWGEDGNGDTESRANEGLPEAGVPCVSLSGGAKLSEEAERRPEKLPAVVFLLPRRLSIKGLLLSGLIGLQRIKLELKGGAWDRRLDPLRQMESELLPARALEFGPEVRANWIVLHEPAAAGLSSRIKISLSAVSETWQKRLLFTK